jgi:dipeptidyl aminopeptidase/acylaminoacyl peptidase
MARRTDLLPALMVALLLLACAAAVVTLLAVGKEAASTFPGKNGKIAFVRTPGGDPGWEDIYTMSPHGQGVKRLTNYPQEDLEPAWSPDGSKIAFMSFRGNLGVWTTYTLYTMNANGTGIGAPNQKHCTRPRACVVSGRQQDSLRERPRRQEAVPYVFMLRDLHHERQRHECGAPHQQYCGRL